MLCLKDNNKILYNKKNTSANTESEWVFTKSIEWSGRKTRMAMAISSGREEEGGKEISKDAMRRSDAIQVGHTAPKARTRLVVVDTAKSVKTKAISGL